MTVASVIPRSNLGGARLSGSRRRLPRIDHALSKLQSPSERERSSLNNSDGERDFRDLQDASREGLCGFPSGLVVPVPDVLDDFP